MKQKTTFVCQNCGATTPKWQGKCPSCHAWNTLVEEIVVKQAKQDTWHIHEKDKAVNASYTLNDIDTKDQHRLLTKDHELNRVLGGGIVKGSVTLISGEPGIGKSTLFLQDSLAMSDIRILYVSGEESLQQIKQRANRIGLNHPNFYLLHTGETQVIFNEIKKIQPQLVIIDSIQTLESPYIESAPGSVSQVRECTAEIVRFAKKTGTPVFIIGHITKDGAIAGPKVLEHMVDTVIQFEGDKHYAYRILRTTKNRFGSAQELGIYEMNETGLRQVSNPSEILITQKEENLSGIAIAATLEGARPLLIETQALVTPSVYGTPQRTVSGFDLRRLQLLLAVLEKRGGFHFGHKDVFLNIAGGIKVEDPAIDLAIMVALLSSYEEKPVASNLCFVGEVGLSGEIRAVSRVEQRIREAEKLGFTQIIVSYYNKKGLNPPDGIEVIFVKTIEEVYKILF